MRHPLKLTLSLALVALAASAAAVASTGSLTILAAHAICTGVNGQIVEFDENGDATCIATPTGAVDGSGTAPEIAFWSDSDTLTSDPKLYWSASNNLRIEGTGANNPCLVIDQQPGVSGGDWRMCSFPTSMSWIAPSGAGIISAAETAATLSLVLSGLGGVSPAGISGAPVLDEDTRWARNADNRHAFIAGEVTALEIGTNGLRLPNQKEVRLFEATANGTDFVSLKAASSLPSSPSYTWGEVGNCSANVNGGALTINGANQIVCSDDDGGAAAAVNPASCAIVESLAAADDDFEVWVPAQAVTVVSVACHCRGACSTPATFSFEDRSGNAMTGSPTCSTGTSNSTYASITAGGSLAAGEGLRFDVTNSPSPGTDTYSVCFRWSYD